MCVLLTKRDVVQEFEDHVATCSKMKGMDMKVDLGKFQVEK